MGRSKKGAVFALLLLAACSQAQGDVIVLDADHAPARAPASEAGASDTDVTVLSQTLNAGDSSQVRAPPKTTTAPTGQSTVTTAADDELGITETSGTTPPPQTAPQTTGKTAIPPAQTSTTASTTTTAPTTTTTTRPLPKIEGPSAPDFTIPLQGGGSFTLSSENRPVLLYSWADW